MKNICDSYIAPEQLSKESIANLKYFGVTDLIATPRSIEVDTSDELIASFRRTFESAEKISNWGMNIFPTIGIRGPKPKRSGLNLFKRMQTLAAEAEVKAIGPVGIKNDTAEDWNTLEAQALIAQDLKLPLILSSSRNAEITNSFKMSQRLIDLGISASSCIFRVRKPETVGALLAEGFHCALSATIPKPDILHLLNLEGTSERFQICSNIYSNHQDLLLIPKLHDYLEKSELAPEILGQLFYENSARFFGF